METYLVGGAVRDFLMGREVRDTDYLVVGSTAEEMRGRGFLPVGAMFPVFLAPVTGDEYALARKEKKDGKGYLGFSVDFGPEVTVEEDLLRRDLTINAIAQDTKTGELIDPFNGKSDIENKVFRHTSDAFGDDPVRVLRVARFMARFGPEWTIAEETKVLMHTMAKKGVLDELSPERVWKELSRALMEDHPRLFFDTLLETDTLKAVFPEIWKLKSSLESYRWHPEGDSFEHTMLVLTQSALFGMDLPSRFAALVHDLGKGLTPREKMPSHFGHDVKGEPLVSAFCDRLKVPNEVSKPAVKATRYHMYMHKLDQLKGKTYDKMFTDMGAANKPVMVDVLYNVGVCDERGRLGSEENEVGHLSFLFDALAAFKSVKFDDVFPNGETDHNKIKEKMRQARINAVEASKREFF